MELAKSKEAFDTWWDSETSPVGRWDKAAFGSRAVDEDLIHAWEVKAGLHWVRNEDGPLKRLRWSVWDRFGLGRPPSRVEGEGQRRGVHRRHERGSAELARGFVSSTTPNPDRRSLGFSSRSTLILGHYAGRTGQRTISFWVFPG